MRLCLDGGICRYGEILNFPAPVSVVIRGSNQTRKLRWVRRAFPLRGRIHVTVFYPLNSTMYSFKILQEESTDLRYLFLDRYMLAGVCFPGSDSVELFGLMGSTGAVAPGIPCHC